MTEKTASVHWKGAGKKGQGQISTETVAQQLHPYGIASRVEDNRRGTKPQEIQAAAHAAGLTVAQMPEPALAAADHVLGNARAKLTLLEYGDYECPACIQAEPLRQHLVEAHRGQLQFVYRHFPLMEVHPNAELAAEAAEAAAAQGQFWPMHHLLFAQPHQLAPAALAGYAQSLGLDMIRFNAEMGDRIYTQRVQEHRRAGERSGLRTTPAIFLNGRAVDVSLGFHKLEASVLAALKVG